MKLPRKWLDPEVLVRVAAALALVGLALMTWSVLVPRPVPVILAMSVGQAIGTASLVLFGLAVFFDRHPKT